MKSVEEIIKILKDNFSSVYCDTCNADGYCEDCHRKAMYWGISDHFAEVIANKIIN